MRREAHAATADERRSRAARPLCFAFLGTGCGARVTPAPRSPRAVLRIREARTASLDAGTRLGYIPYEIETLGAGLVGDLEGAVVLEHRHDLVGKEPHVAFALFVGHSAVTELRDEMVHPALAHHRADLIEHLFRGACRVQADEEVDRLVLDLRVRELRIGLRHLGVELVALD